MLLNLPNCYHPNNNAVHSDAQLGKSNNRQSASLYDLIPAIPQNAKPAEEWRKAYNHY